MVPIVLDQFGDPADLGARGPAASAGVEADTVSIRAREIDLARLSRLAKKEEAGVFPQRPRV